LNVNYSSVEWSTGETTQTLEITSSGNYFVNVIDENGCEGQDDFDFTFVSLPNVNAGQDVNSDCSNGSFLEVTGDGNLSWQPSPFLKTITETYVQANPTQTTTFTAQAEQNGCFATDDVVVTVECTFLYVPNSITPNGDGVNDVLQIIGTGIGDFHIAIFDRWGDVVYESNDINQAWTGGKNDYYVQDGVYSFVITAYDLEGLPITENIQIYGSVLVLR
jgi:gliding motility-associated-like protein